MLMGMLVAVTSVNATLAALNVTVPDRSTAEIDPVGLTAPCAAAKAGDRNARIAHVARIVVETGFESAGRTRVSAKFADLSVAPGTRLTRRAVIRESATTTFV